MKGQLTLDLWPENSPAEEETAWGGRTPRVWQSSALLVALASLREGKRAVIRAATGSGKSILQAEIIARIRDKLAPGERILVTAPTRDLVRQLSATIAERSPDCVGRFFTDEKRIDRPVIVACHRSLERLGKVLQVSGLKLHAWIPDEAHKTEAPEVVRFARRHAARCPRLGFTATPFRASVHEALTLFDELAYEYNAQDAISDGVIVAPEIRPYRGEETTIDDACLGMIREALPLGPGLVNATDIADAEAYALVLSAEGIRAKAVHSRLPRDEVAERLRHLRAGELACLVHVNMLAEGIDFPWLTWLCLRRGVESRIRFIQEVGRIMRTAPGKERGLVLDPRDLFGKLELDYEAVIGDRPPGPPKIELAPPERDEASEDPELTDPVTIKQSAAAYIRRMATRSRVEGFSAWTLKVDRSDWRSRDATERQLHLVRRLMYPAADIGGLPQDHRLSLRQSVVAALRGLLSMRDVSDLLTVLEVLAQSEDWPYGDDAKAVA